MNHHYQVTPFSARQSQKLRNVRIHSPCLVQILTGSKRLYWRETAVELSAAQLLICEPGASLSFENLPHKGAFSSRMFSFHCLPERSMLELSRQRADTGRSEVVGLDSALRETLHALAGFNLDEMSLATQTYWLMGLYQQLAERGALHRLIPDSELSFSQKLSRYLALTPSQDHPLENVAERFAVSRATLIRKLKQEGTQYREILAEVRLNHALGLMQKGDHNVALLAQLCGYQSEGRFSQRFKAKFGLTPHEYIKTLHCAN